jgi:hypothetical protein
MEQADEAFEVEPASYVYALFHPDDAEFAFPRYI